MIITTAAITPITSQFVESLAIGGFVAGDGNRVAVGGGGFISAGAGEMCRG